MGQLMRAIQEDAEPAISGRTTIGTMALVEAAYRSFREGRAVPIEEVRAEAAIA
jgi:predicted dehydrogenase